MWTITLADTTADKPAQAGPTDALGAEVRVGGDTTFEPVHIPAFLAGTELLFYVTDNAGTPELHYTVDPEPDPADAETAQVVGRVAVAADGTLAVV